MVVPLYYGKTEGTNIIADKVFDSAGFSSLPKSEMVGAIDATSTEGSGTKKRIERVALYDEKGVIANKVMARHGIANPYPDEMGDLLDMFDTVHETDYGSSADIFSKGKELNIDFTKPAHEIYKQLAQDWLQRNGAELTVQKQQLAKALLSMSDEQFKEFYHSALVPNTFEELKKKKEELDAPVPAAEKPDQGLKFGLRTAYTSGDFDDVNSIDEGAKYHIGLAAANSAIEPHYYGHSSYTSPTRAVTVYVVDNLKQAQATFHMVNGNPNTEMPYKTEEQAKNDVVRLSAMDKDTRVRHDVVIVPRDFLRKNLGKELEYMKAYEEDSKRVTHHSKGGSVNMHDFLQEMKKDSELPINSLTDYEQKAPLAAPLVEIAGKGQQKSL